MMFTYFTSFYGSGGVGGAVFPSSWKLGGIFIVFLIAFMFKPPLPPKGV